LRRFARLADVGDDALDWATIERLLSMGLLPLRFRGRISALGPEQPLPPARWLGGSVEIPDTEYKQTV
jgi:hypothetical protein